MKQPIQPLALDIHGTLRFKENALVRYILDNGGIDMNHLAVQDFPQEDREQFAQLIGYSLSGFADLSYVTDETYDAAEKMYEDGLSEADARVASLQATLEEVREGLRKATPAVFRIHPDDLEV
jgi:hypothetical protein